MTTTHAQISNNSPMYIIKGREFRNKFEEKRSIIYRKREDPNKKEKLYGINGDNLKYQQKNLTFTLSLDI